MVAALTLLLLFTLATIAPPVVPFVFCAGGFLATILYTRRTGESISVQSGARMGFMTCLWAFVVILLMSCLVVAMLASPELVRPSNNRHRRRSRGIRRWPRRWRKR